jgi:hypothetical protein
MADDRCTTSELFDALWTALTDVIGPTAAATLLHESIKRARAAHPGVDDVAIVQRHFEYTYTVPAAWNTTDAAPRKRFQAIVEELWPLLMGLTGTLVVRRLSAVPQLVECGVIPSAAKRNGRDNKDNKKEAKW